MTTKTTILSLALAAAGSLTATAGTPAPAAAPAAAPESSLWTGSVTLGYDSKYIFRGVHVNDGVAPLWYADDLSTAALDLNYAINDRLTLNLNAWYANAGGGNFTAYDELNLYTRLLYKFNDTFSGGVSFRYYDYPFNSGWGQQYEPGLEGVWSPCANTTVNMGLFYETETDALYAELAASYTHKLCDTTSLVFGGLISYLDRDGMGVDTSGFNHAALFIKAPITLKSNLTLTPYVAYNLPMDTVEDADGLNPGQDDQFYYGASLSVGF